MCITARNREHKCKFKKNTARTTEYNETLSLIPPGTVSVIGNLSRISSGPVNIKKIVVEQHEFVSINANSTRTPPGPVKKIKNRTEFHQDSWN